MTHSISLQILGYTASVLIAVSLLMRSIVRLRIVNMAGAATFSLYGFLIGAYPVGLLNLLTTCINAVQLVRLRKRTEIFRVLEIAPDAPYVRYFLEFEEKEIRRYLPHFRYDPEEQRFALMVVRDLVPAGLVVGRQDGQTLRVDLDYVVAQFRDLKVARFLFVDEAEYFRQRGVREIVSPADTTEHATYLAHMGYRPIGDGRMYRLDLG